MTALASTAGHDAVYAHGRIAVLQQLLLSKTDLDRMLGAHDAADLARQFIEMKFSSRINQGIADPDAVLTAMAHWVRDEVFSMAPEKSLMAFDVLWLEGDIPLLSYLLKKRLGMTSAISEQPSPAFTLYPLESWVDMVEHGRGWDDHHPVSVRTVVEQALALKDPTPAAIDTLAARWGAKEQVAAAKRAKSAGVLRYVRHAIDLQNIRTALRSLDRTPEERRALLVDGGTVAPAKLLGTPADIALAVELADLGYGVADAIRNKDDDVRALEQALSAVTAGDIAAMWNVPLAPEPLFAFAALAFSQIRLLRTVLLAKRAGFSPQDVKRVLPPFIPATHYVL